VSLAALGFRYRFKQIFKQSIAAMPVLAQKAYVRSHMWVWLLSAFAWGLSGWLFFTNIPVQNQYICATMLNVVGFAAVQNLTTYKTVVRAFVNVLMGTQLVGACWYIIYVGKLDVPLIQVVHLSSIILIWLLLHTLNKRLYASFRNNLVLQYRNATLIHSLNRQTELLAHEKQIALNANEVIQRFYSSAAHDIRQPVYALKLYAEVAMADAVQVPELLPKMSASCDAINKLFNTLFEFEQINAGHVNVHYQVVDIDQLVEGLEFEFKPLARLKKIEFRTHGISGFLQTDALLVKRILTCFVTNAIKYTHHGGILLAVRKKSNFIVFEVWDTGIGIDPVHLRRVFDEFYKVNEFSSANEGFGLGLSIVKRLSHYAENSTISAHSKVGQGSVFRFALPIKIYTPPYVPSRLDNMKSLPLVLDFDISDV
jgi:signal transduction histidine kinase